MESVKKFEISIIESYNVPIARKKIAETAKEIGFDEKAVEEISIVVTELGVNLLDHSAINGKIICSYIKEGQKEGIQVESIDEGPGIANIEAMMEDGVSSSGSLGIGLGAVRRLMSDLKISSTTKDRMKSNNQRTGTKIITKKYLPLKEHDKDKLIREIRYSIFTRSKIGENFNGDNYFIKHFEDRSLISVIDGLGHGKEASIASKKAVIYLSENYYKELDDIIRELHKFLKHTRGIAISLALINETNGTLDYIGIGNVMTKVFNSPQPIRPINYNGTVGKALRSFKTLSYSWRVGNIIIMTSDGISTRYDVENGQISLNQHPMLIAKKIFDIYNKKHDDATIIVGGPV
jgi:anti-sigma regulatory factor (Ser/Thr protein kinase)